MSWSERDIRKRVKRSERLPLRRRLVVNTIVILLGAAFLFPIVWMLIISFKSQSRIASMPPDVFSAFTLENYRSVLNIGVDATAARATLMRNKSAAFVRGLLNTTLYAVCSVLIAALVGVPAAYGLSRYRNAAKERLAFVFLSFRFVPQLLIIVPLYLVYQRVGLYGTYAGVTWAYILISIPFVVWITRSYMDDIPFELEQAAMLDGYSRQATFFRVVLPLARPGIAAALIISFIYAWNSFTFGFVLATTKLQPATVKILTYYDITDLHYGRIAAAMMVATLPMIVVSQIASSYLVSGLSMGAVKR